ncbi:MAG: GNAT family N-acetyltransferase [Myxococcota bacterium]|nr:GNAT family N-acetyltransferase [Myxococcota bacterium]
MHCTAPIQTNQPAASPARHSDGGPLTRLEVSEVTTPAGLSELCAEWSALLASSPEATPFQAWEWIEPWWRHLGRGHPLVLLAHEGGRLVGLLPLYRARRFGLRRIACMGEPGSDYHALLALPGWEAACREAFWHHLYSRRTHWDVVDLQQLPEGSTLAQPVGNGWLRPRLSLIRLCPVVELPDSWERFKARLGKNLRGSLGRRLRQLQRAFGQVALETVGPDAIEATLEALFQQNSQRWQRRGRRGFFDHPANRAWQKEAAPGLQRRGMLRLHRLVVDGRICATSYCVRHGARVIYYNGGFDLALARYSLGNVLMAYAIEQAIREGASVFDFARGQESYKYEWGGQDRRSYRLILSHGTVRSWLALGLAEAETHIERAASNLVPLLWGRQSIFHRLHRHRHLQRWFHRRCEAAPEG